MILHNCDVMTGLARIPTSSVDCIVTSPPYWGLRNYGHSDQIGLEPTFQEFLAKLVAVFAECHRVLKPKGTLWVNLGDCYYTGAGAARLPGGGTQGKQFKGPRTQPNRIPGSVSLPRKSLVGQPWRLAFALQDAGWVLRNDIIWQKPSAMPCSAKDRCTVSHEYVFFLTKQRRYWSDFQAIAEPSQGKPTKKVHGWASGTDPHDPVAHNMPANYKGSIPGRKDGPGQDRRSTKPRGRKYSVDNENQSAPSTRMGRPPGWRNDPQPETRNARTVWTIASCPYPDAHFATFPPELPRRCILAGCPFGGVVLDPFAGSGTTLAVALELGREAIGIELNPEYCDLIRDRVKNKQLLLMEAV